jgi:hypothetical protein
VLGSKNINKPVLKIFDKTVWLWSRLDWLLPWPGLSLIAIGRRLPEGSAAVDAGAREEAVAKAS